MADGTPTIWSNLRASVTTFTNAEGVTFANLAIKGNAGGTDQSAHNGAQTKLIVDTVTGELNVVFK